MKIYLDTCTFNRPFDNQRLIRIQLEAEAKLFIQNLIKDHKIELVWSYILDFENEQNPFIERKKAIKKWRALSSVDVQETPNLLGVARGLAAIGVKPKDALHVASAMEGQAIYFLTTDDKLLKKLTGYDGIQAINPVDFIRISDDYDN